MMFYWHRAFYSSSMLKVNTKVRKCFMWGKIIVFLNVVGFILQMIFIKPTTKWTTATPIQLAISIFFILAMFLFGFYLTLERKEKKEDGANASKDYEKK